MRYFRRSGPSILVEDGPDLKRFVTGPVPPSDDNPQGVPGARLAYDDSQEDQARHAEQLAGAPGWYEVDANDKPVFPDQTPAFVLLAEPPAPFTRTFPSFGASAQAPETPADEPES